MYYDRPNMVKNALRSILLANEHYTNWQLAFYDDGSSIPGKPIAEKMLKDKVHYYRTEITPAEKIQRNGVMGEAINQILDSSEYDIAIMLCDDDALYPTYLKNLNHYFLTHKVSSCYSNVILYNPLKEPFEQAINRPIDYSCYLNHYKNPINPSSAVDASQVAWRRNSIRFPVGVNSNHDAHFYAQLYKSFGPSHYSGFISQFKGFHDVQLNRIPFHRAVNEMAVMDQNSCK